MTRFAPLLILFLATSAHAATKQQAEKSLNDVYGRLTYFLGTYASYVIDADNLAATIPVVRATILASNAPQFKKDAGLAQLAVAEGEIAASRALAAEAFALHLEAKQLRLEAEAQYQAGDYDGCYAKCGMALMKCNFADTKIIAAMAALASASQRVSNVLFSFR